VFHYRKVFARSYMELRLVMGAVVSACVLIAVLFVGISFGIFFIFKVPEAASSLVRLVFFLSSFIFSSSQAIVFSCLFQLAKMFFFSFVFFLLVFVLGLIA
jgi:hypothetical protein